jgi:hypothetical protein
VARGFLISDFLPLHFGISIYGFGGTLFHVEGDWMRSLSLKFCFYTFCQRLVLVIFSFDSFLFSCSMYPYHPQSGGKYAAVAPLLSLSLSLSGCDHRKDDAGGDEDGLVRFVCPTGLLSSKA